MMNLACLGFALFHVAPAPGGHHDALPIEAEVLEQSTPLEERLLTVLGQMVEKPQVEEEWFTEGLVAKVSPGRMRSILRRTLKDCGAPIEHLALEGNTEHSGKFRITCEGGRDFVTTLGVEASAPHRIHMIYFSTPTWSSFEAIGSELEALPGDVSFAVHELGESEPRVRFELEPDLSLGIGSAFKLYILGALGSEVAAGKRRWTDLVELRAEHRSLPTGFLQKWPEGAPLTLHSLASLMISQSGNTATDHLLFSLGRKRVEAEMEVMGNQHVARNLPFLSTAEMFRLKASDGGLRAQAYLELDVEGRRAYLRDVIASVPVEEVVVNVLLTPTYIDSIEWFASARDLSRAFDFLRRRIVAGDEMTAGILAINPGSGLPADRFRYLGFKGGSEGGVLNLSFLVQTHDERWWTVIGTWNNSEAAVSTIKLLEYCDSALELCAREAESPR